MTLTTEQLDELEARAKAAVAGYPLTAADWKFIDSATPETVGHLVSVYRAALAWNEARKAYVAAQDEYEDGEGDADEALERLTRARDAYDVTPLVEALRGRP